MATTDHRSKLREAGRRLGMIERRSDHLTSSRRRLFLMSGDTAAEPTRARWRGRPLLLPTSASRVTLAVFGRDRTKFRAFYDRHRPRMTLAVDDGSGGQPHRGMELAAVALRAVEGRSDFVVPKVLAQGEIDGCAYLLETYIDGAAPTTTPEKARAIELLVDGLARWYPEHGITVSPLRDHLNVVRVGEAVLDFVDEYPWQEGWVDRATVRRLAVGALDPDSGYPVSLCHGDLTLLNVLLLDDDRIALIDWETARTMPIAFDVTKPLTSTRPQVYRARLDDIRSMLAGPDGSDVSPPDDQLVVAAFRWLAEWRTYLDVSASVGREAHAQRRVDRVLRFVTEVVREPSTPAQG